MLIVARKAEEALLKTLKVMWLEAPTHRCLYLRSSQITVLKEELLSAVAKALEQIGEADLSQVYLCEDNDIFVISRSLTYKRVEQFLAHLAPKLEPVPLGGLASLFEIGVDWWRLKFICTKKLECLESPEKSPKPKADTADKVDARSIIDELDRDLLSSLSMRRDMRANPEILVVEDDAFSRRLVGNVLEKKYSLTSVPDGRGAIFSYVNKAPDILFLDIGLPDISGHEVLKKILKIDPQAYVVMFSGNGDKINIIKSVELGAKGFVGKPFTAEKLVHYIARSPFVQAKEGREKDHGDSVG